MNPGDRQPEGQDGDDHGEEVCLLPELLFMLSPNPLTATLQIVIPDLTQLRALLREMNLRGHGPWPRSAGTTSPPPAGAGWMPVTDEDVANWPAPVASPGPAVPPEPAATPEPAAPPEPAANPEPAAWGAWDANIWGLPTPPPTPPTPPPPAVVEGEEEDENDDNDDDENDDEDDDMDDDDNGGAAAAASPSRGE